MNIPPGNTVTGSLIELDINRRNALAVKRRSNREPGDGLQAALAVSRIRRRINYTLTVDHRDLL